MRQVTEQSVRFRAALSSIKLIQASSVLDLSEDDFEFLTSNKVWIATDRSRARRCVEACGYGTLDFVGYPRFPAPVEFIAALIAYYVHPFNIQTAFLIMEGSFFFECYGDHRDLHSFPTRRSSDLARRRGHVDQAGQLGVPAHRADRGAVLRARSEEHTSALHSRPHLVCRLLRE